MSIQTHSQSVFEQLGPAIARMLGLDPGKVRCQHMQGAAATATTWPMTQPLMQPCWPLAVLG